MSHQLIYVSLSEALQLEGVTGKGQRELSILRPIISALPYWLTASYSCHRPSQQGHQFVGPQGEFLLFACTHKQTTTEPTVK